MRHYLVNDYLSLSQTVFANTVIHSDKNSFWHDHEFYEIAMVLQGVGTHFTRTHKDALSPGNVVAINRGEPHRYFSEEGLTIFNLLANREALERIQSHFSSPRILSTVFVPDFLEGRKGGYKVFRLNAKTFSLLRVRMEMILAEVKSDRLENNPALELWLGIFLLELCRLEGNKNKSNTPYLPDDKISGVLKHIDDNLQKSLTLENLASLTEMNVSYFSRWFKKRTGYSPVEYVNEIRVEKACALLRGSNKSVSEIGEFTGFGSNSMFFQMFKRVTGSSPRKYRQIMGRT